MRIGVVSDIHRKKKTQEAVDRELNAFVSYMNEYVQPDLVMALGDLIHHDTKEEDKRQLAAVRDALDSINAPVRYLLGNHDVMRLSPEECATVLDQDRFGHEVVAGEDILFLDSSARWLSGSRGEISEEQMAFLEETLPAVEDALLFVHHPIHYHNVEDTVFWDVYPERAFCGNKKEINYLIGELGGVRAVFNGHLHEHDHTVFEGIDHVTVEPFSRKTRGAGPTGAHAVVDTEEGITVLMQDVEDDIARYSLE